MNSILEWLGTLGLDQYARLFAENDIDLEVLPSLSEQDLEKLGVSMGHRKRLLKAIAERDVRPDSPMRGDLTAEPVIDANSGAERRQVTVMFCDLVSSTALSQRLDPEELRTVIRNYQQAAATVIERFDGHIAQYLGDGLLVYFGHPIAHEDDAQRALRAALSIVSTLTESTRPLQVRIGIHTGVVVVGEIGGGVRREQLALGDTPNVAARLQSLAEPNAVLISENSRRLAGGGFDYVDLGLQALNGVAQPIQIWRVAGLSGTASRFDAMTLGILTPLVGREHEISMLLERWQLAQDGEGQVVLLSGEPGIGKSRILSALLERLARHEVLPLRFQCSAYHQHSALYPSIDNLERALRFARDELPHSKLDKLEALLIGEYGLPRVDVRFIAMLLNIPCEDRYGVLATTPQKIKDETIRTLFDILSAAARRHPTVMLFEDAHWSDPTSLEALDLVIDRVRDVPVLVVITFRPEFQSRWGMHGHVTALTLSRMTRAQSSAIVDRMTHGKALPPELLARILAKTDGVPLFVEELTKTILESGKLKDARDHYEYMGDPDDLAIPSSLRDSLMARLDRFPTAKEIAQIGSAIGREFGFDLLAAVARRSEAELCLALDQLTDAGLAFRRGSPPDATFVFKHALVQDVAYDSMLKSRRQSLHARIARALMTRFPSIDGSEPETLAHHLTLAGETSAAIDYWLKAGRLSLTRLAIEEALSHLNRGLQLTELLEPSHERDAFELDFRVQLGTAWIAKRGFAGSEVWDSLHPALALAARLGRHRQLGMIERGLWVNTNTRGRIEESFQWVHALLDTARVSDDADLLLLGNSTACATHHWVGNFKRSLEYADQVLASYDERAHRYIGDVTNIDPKSAVCCWGTFAYWALGYPEQALKMVAMNDEHSRRRGHVFNLGFVLTGAGIVLDVLRDPHRMMTRAEEAEQLGRAHGMPYVSETLAQVLKGVVWIRSGNLNEGIPRLRSAIEIWSRYGNALWTPYLRSILAEGYALNGEVDTGLELIEESTAQIHRPGSGERAHLAEILRLKGWMLERKGDSTGAEQLFHQSLDCARAQEAKSWELRTAMSLACLWRNRGRISDARDLVASVYARFTEGFDTPDLVDARTLVSQLGDPP